ncbi:MAG TPA: ATP-binding protein [Thermomicrobiales bacterium]|nr:ATP-binding protein [Thermomicrobiales bacterium]
MIRRIPIRWRLAFWYTVLTVGVLIVFTAAVYTGMKRNLSNQLDEDLKSQAALAAEAVNLKNFETFETTYEFTDEALLRVILNTGEVYNYRDTRQAPPRLTDVAAAQQGKTVLSTVTYEREKLRVISVPLQVSDGTIVGALQLGYSMRRITDPLNVLVQALWVIGPLALLSAAALGYLLAGRALRPVARITTLASQIGGDDLHSRLNLDLPNDELGRLARTFDSMLDRIDGAFQRQQQFTGDAAHELRTPLALMRSQIDLAVSQADTADEYREALVALDGDVARMTTLVGTLLSLARADAGELVPNREEIDLAWLAADVVEQMTPLAEENEIRLAMSLQVTVVQADADMVIQVLVNLVDNAIKNTLSGGTVTVETGKDRGQAIVTVRDTGIGIAPEHLTHIFDRFYRVDTGRARARGGSGLGLAICQSIARAHDGEITATSVLGTGSAFTLRLPM